MKTKKEIAEAAGISESAVCWRMRSRNVEPEVYVGEPGKQIAYYSEEDAEKIIDLDRQKPGRKPRGNNNKD